jgi:galactokinase
VYFGKPSGLLDQAAIAIGGVCLMDFADEAAPKFEKLKWDFDNISIFIINCGGDHCGLTDEYTAIKSEMEQVAAYFGKKKLREVDFDDFNNALPELKKALSGRAILRAMHFFEENERVEQLALAFREKIEDLMLYMVNTSGQSSYMLLQNCFPAGDTAQPIPLALKLFEEADGVVAVRVHGGGFAGTVLCMVETPYADSFKDYAGSLFGADSVFKVDIREEGAACIGQVE